MILFGIAAIHGPIVLFTMETSDIVIITALKSGKEKE
jgi:hypothetical protein